MSRVDIISSLMNKKNSQSGDFIFDSLTAPPILSIFTVEDINKLYKIATSIRYSANISRKYELIDEIMSQRGFKRAHCGTNRVVYECLYNPVFVAKVAIDKVGIKDSPAEYINQEIFKPFCTKIFEVDPSGVIAFVEKVNPITSIEEFNSVAADIFDLMISKIIGKYVVDDLGLDNFMNYGLRYDPFSGKEFGPVILDFPYVYELSERKLICKNSLNTPYGQITCNGEIDYDTNLSKIICTKCGKTYTALDLKKDHGNILLEYIDKIKSKGANTMRVKVKFDGKVIVDSGISSKKTFTKEEMDSIASGINTVKDGDEFITPIDEVEFIRPKKRKLIVEREFDRMQNEYLKTLREQNQKQESSGKIYISNKATALVTDFEDDIKQTENDDSGFTISSNISEEVNSETEIISEENPEPEEETVSEKVNSETEIISEENPEPEEETVSEEEVPLIETEEEVSSVETEEESIIEENSTDDTSSNSETTTTDDVKYEKFDPDKYSYLDPSMDANTVAKQNRAQRRENNRNKSNKKFYSKYDKKNLNKY